MTWVIVALLYLPLSVVFTILIGKAIKHGWVEPRR